MQRIIYQKKLIRWNFIDILYIFRKITFGTRISGVCILFCCVNFLSIKVESIVFILEIFCEGLGDSEPKPVSPSLSGSLFSLFSPSIVC